MARASALWVMAAAALAAPAAMAGSAPVAFYPSLGYGQRPLAHAPLDQGARRPPAPDRYERKAHDEEAERLPGAFFADAGGVGPDEFEWSGGYVVGGASAGSFAEASARAEGSVGVGVRIGRHGEGRHGEGGHGGGHMPTGCGCKK